MSIKVEALVEQILSEESPQVVDADQESLQALLGWCIKAYSALSQSSEEHVPPYREVDKVTPTEVIVTAAGLLRESDVSSFELAMIFNV